MFSQHQQARGDHKAGDCEPRNRLGDRRAPSGHCNRLRPRACECGEAKRLCLECFSNLRHSLRGTWRVTVRSAVPSPDAGRANRMRGSVCLHVTHLSKSRRRDARTCACICEVRSTSPGTIASARSIAFELQVPGYSSSSKFEANISGHNRNAGLGTKLSAPCPSASTRGAQFSPSCKSEQ